HNIGTRGLALARSRPKAAPRSWGIMASRLSKSCSPGTRSAQRVQLTQKLALCLSVAFLSTASTGFAQMMLKPVQPGEPITLLPGDAAVFESSEFRKDLPCTVTG